MFPEPSEGSSEIISKSVNISGCSKKSTYCEKVESYPHVYVKNLLRKVRGYDVFFDKNRDEEDGEEMAGRDDRSERFFCKTITRTVFPQMAKNRNQQWKLIVNEEGYSQRITIEECVR